MNVNVNVNVTVNPIHLWLHYIKGTSLLRIILVINKKVPIINTFPHATICF